MGRAPCCDKANVKKGPWSPEEDAKLKDYIHKSGTGGNWISLPQKAGLKRCGKSCRLRWLNYLRPNIKHGDFTDNEDMIICSLFASIGSRWSIIAAQLPGRTDNDIKNYWNTKLKKKLMGKVNTTATTKSKLLSVLDHQPSSITSSSPYSAPSTPISAYKFADNYFTTANSSTLSAPDYETFSSVSSSALVNAAAHSMHSYQGFQDTSFPRSCSSSDGSSSYQISYGKEAAGQGYNLDLFPNYFYNGVDFDPQNPKINSFDQIMKPLDDGLEEIKQLISTNLCSNFFVDEIKTEEKLAY